MTTSKAFDLALFVGTPANIGDGVVVTALGPPFVSQFRPVMTEAPTDGNIYGRQFGAWAAVASGGGGSGGIPDAPNDGTAYVRQSGAWTNILDAGTF